MIVSSSPIMLLLFCTHICSKTPTNECKAEWGRYPLIINIQKRALKCFNHLESSHIDTLQTQRAEPRKESSPMLVLRITAPPPPPPSDTLWPVSHTNTAFQTPLPEIESKDIDPHQEQPLLPQIGNRKMTHKKNHSNQKKTEYVVTVRQVRLRHRCTSSYNLVHSVK